MAAHGVSATGNKEGEKLMENNIQTNGITLLTAEQVRHATNRHYKLLMVLDVDGFDVPQAMFDWQAIADELNDELRKAVEHGD